MTATNLVSLSSDRVPGPRLDKGAQSSPSGGEPIGSEGGAGAQELLQGHPLILCDVSDLTSLRVATPPDIGVLSAWVEGGEHGDLCFGDADGHRIVSVVAPTLCMGLVSFSPEGVASLAKVGRKLAALGSYRSWTPVLLPADADGLRAMLATDLVATLREQARYAVRLARELASLRGLFEHTQNAFSALEAHVSGLATPSARLVFENEPEKEFIVGGSDITEIRQLLPVNSAGLVLFQLHLRQIPSGGFSVFLRTLEDEAVHGLWMFMPSQLKLGWMTFSLPSGITGAERTLEVVMSSASATSGLPRFALGAPQPMSDYRAKTAGRGLPPTRSLAMRIWKGLAGVRSPLSAGLAGGKAPILGDASGNAAPPQVRDVPLSLEILRSVRRVTCDWDPGFAVVEGLIERRGLQCHPPPGGEITLATLDAFVADDIAAFSAFCCVESPDSAPVEFGIAFSSLPEGDIAAKVLASETRSATSNFAFSGWSAVSHGQPTSISLDLTQSHGQIYFATRMADGARNWRSWATFNDVKVSVTSNAYLDR